MRKLMDAARVVGLVQGADRLVHVFGVRTAGDLDLLAAHKPKYVGCDTTRGAAVAS
jgi:hypothetical protein